jgi:hypothetical protein
VARTGSAAQPYARPLAGIAPGAGFCVVWQPAI